MLARSLSRLASVGTQVRARLSTAAAPMAPTVPPRRGSYLEAWVSSYDNARKGIMRLNPEVWGLPMRLDIVHEDVVCYRACLRKGGAKAKTRGEVSGTGKKPFPQKGRGAARHGSKRAPQWRGGGVAHPPRPRDFSYSINKRVRALAVKVALSSKFETGQLVIMDSLAVGEAEGAGKTGLLRSRLAKELCIDVGRHRVLLVHAGEESAMVERAAANIPRVSAVHAARLTTHDVVTHSLLIASLPAVNVLEAWLQRERRHALGTEPQGPGDRTGTDGLSRYLVRALPASLERVHVTSSGEPLRWARVDVPAQRISALG